MAVPSTAVVDACFGAKIYPESLNFQCYGLMTELLQSCYAQPGLGLLKMPKVRRDGTAGGCLRVRGTRPHVNASIGRPMFATFVHDRFVSRNSAFRAFVVYFAISAALVWLAGRVRP